MTGSRVVLAESDGDLRVLLAEGLAAYGYAVEATADGAEAIALVRDRPDAALVLDWFALPASGPAVLRELRADPRAAPRRIVVISTSPRIAHDVLPARVGWLQKPFTIEDLVRELERPR